MWTWILSWWPLVWRKTLEQRKAEHEADVIAMQKNCFNTVESNDKHYRTELENVKAKHAEELAAVKLRCENYMDERRESLFTLKKENHAFRLIAKQLAELSQLESRPLGRNGLAPQHEEWTKDCCGNEIPVG